MVTQAVTSPSRHVIRNTFGNLSDTSMSLQSTVHTVKTAGNGPEAGDIPGIMLPIDFAIFYQISHSTSGTKGYS